MVRAKADSRSVALEQKRAEPFYLTPEYRAWREAVIARAGARCEAVDNDRRCPKSAPSHRMFADHKRERRDGGAPYDPANGQCLCGHHHTVKTIAARVQRLRG